MNNDFNSADGVNDLKISDFKFIPSYQIELTDSSPENLALLKKDNIDIFGENGIGKSEYGLDIDIVKLNRYV